MFVAGTVSSDSAIGVATSSHSLTGAIAATGFWGLKADGTLLVENTASYSTGLTYASGDIIQFCFDIVAGLAWVGVNGTWYNDNPGGTATSFTFTPNAALHVCARGGNGAGATNFTISADYYSVNTPILMNFDGDNASTSIVNTGVGPDFTVNGNTIISNAQSKFGGTSMYLDGAGDFLTGSGYSLLNLGTVDFTIEFWWYHTVTNSGKPLIDFRPTAANGAYPYIYFSSTSLAYYVSSANRITTSAGAVTTSNWHHIAISRVSGVTTMYLNGSTIGTWADATNYSVGATVPLIGANSVSSGQVYSNGYMDGLRVVVGRSVFNGGSAPTVKPGPIGHVYGFSSVVDTDGTGLLITGEGTAGTVPTDSIGHSVFATGNATLSATVAKVGSTSMYFDGVDDALSVLLTPELELRSKDFALDFWFYPTSVTGNRSVIRCSGSTNTYGLSVYMTGATVQCWASVANGAWFISGITIGTAIINTWQHVRLERQGSQITTYFNGAATNSAPIVGAIYVHPTARWWLGNDANLGGDYAGYIDTCRLTFGRPSRTFTFTANTGELSTVVPFLSSHGFNGDGDTKGLVWSYYDSAGEITTDYQYGIGCLDLPSGGHAEIDAIVHLAAGAASDTTLGCVDFTVGMFVKYTGGTVYLFSQGAPGSITGTTQGKRQGVALYIDSSGSIHVLAGNLDRDGNAGLYHWKTANGAVKTLSTMFQHIELSIGSNVPYVFVGGMLTTLATQVEGTAANLSTCAVYATNRLQIGSVGKEQSGTYAGIGSPLTSAATKVDEFYAISGEAWHTSSFAIPTTELLQEYVDAYMRGFDASSSYDPWAPNISILPLTPPTFQQVQSETLSHPERATCIMDSARLENETSLSRGSKILQIYDQPKMRGMISGYLTVGVTPTRQLVYALDKKAGMWHAKSTWSDPTTGYYEFNGLTMGRPYMIMAVDVSSQYNAVIADNVLPG